METVSPIVPKTQIQKIILDSIIQEPVEEPKKEVKSTFIPKKIKIKMPSRVKKVVENPTKIELPEEKPVNFVTDIAQNVIEKAVEQFIPEKIVEPVINSLQKSIRLVELPEHDMDFAKSWHYSTQNELIPDRVILEYNVYNQVLDELSKDELKLPDNFIGKDLAYDIRTFVLRDFNNNGVVYSKDNLYHRTFYSHCVRRALDSLRQGVFSDSEGYKNKHPEIADIIERRINELLVENLIK